MTNSVSTRTDRVSARASDDMQAPASFAEDAEKILREHDTSSRFRTDLGWWAYVVGGISVAFTLYHLYFALDRPFSGWMHTTLHLAGATALVFMLYPASRKLLQPKPEEKRWISILVGRGKGIAWYDLILASVGAFSSLYIFFRYDYLTSNAVQILGYSPWDTAVAVLGVLLVLEATRRCVGLPIVIIAVLAMTYAIFGNHSPVFSHRGRSWDDFATDIFLSTNGVFGTPLQVSSNFIFLFLFFAVVLLRTNIGQLFNDLAFRLAGRYSGGPAKAAVVASGLQGTVTGSSVANTVASGSFTIPLMKKAGFKPKVAAATEATASTGGQLMPPIMGAAAFIIAQNVPGIEYNDLIVIAIIPSVLYFLGVMLAVHFEAKRHEIHGLPVSDLPTWKSLLTRIDLLLPLVIIIGTLLSGLTATTAALYGIATAFLLSFIRTSTRLGPRGLLDLFVAGARSALPVITACATAGIVAGTVTTTGLGGQLGRGLVDLAGGNFLLVLFMVMVACIILGMGLPTTANYVVTAAVAAPILYTNFDVPLIAAHLFVFFFGILADVTPPVCLAAFAGAGIANANPMAAGVTALRLAVAAFLIPYAFILEPALLLQGTIPDLLKALSTLVIGLVALAAGLAGYFLTRTGIVDRLLLIGAGILLIYPDLMISIAGGVMFAIAALLQLVSRKRHGAVTDSPEPGSDAEEQKLNETEAIRTV